MIVEPGAERRSGSAATDASDPSTCGNARQLAVLRAGIGAVDAGEVRRQRQRDDEQKNSDEQASAGLHQNRK